MKFLAEVGFGSVQDEQKILTSHSQALESEYTSRENWYFPYNVEKYRHFECQYLHNGTRYKKNHDIVNGRLHVTIIPEYQEL